jgi:hypothetical protein
MLTYTSKAYLLQPTMSTSNGIQVTEYLGIYLKELLLAELGEQKDPEMPDLPLESLEELRYSAVVIAQAANNQSKRITSLHYETNKRAIAAERMTWSVTDYQEELLLKKGKRCTGMQDEIEQELLRLFPPDDKETIVKPTSVVDCNGIILLWFLPGLLNSQRKVKSISIPSEITVLI